ncbi:unnamed protein product [Dicrocoelium dendriticum]|nr:unnamed protein product [Dicrocoelium dendriticum]
MSGPSGAIRRHLGSRACSRPHAPLHPLSSLMSLALFDVVKGRVTSLKEYGAFISIGHTGKQGLLHRSQISNHPVDRIEDVLENGEEVFCKVINMRDGRIGLSMRLVDQTTGRDKDPDNLIASPGHLLSSVGGYQSLNELVPSRTSPCASASVCDRWLEVTVVT